MIRFADRNGAFASIDVDQESSLLEISITNKEGYFSYVELDVKTSIIFSKELRKSIADLKNNQ